MMTVNDELARTAQIAMATYFKEYEPLVWGTEGHY
jgi:hypothetical protein